MARTAVLPEAAAVGALSALKRPSPLRSDVAYRVSHPRRQRMDRAARRSGESGQAQSALANARSIGLSPASDCWAFLGSTRFIGMSIIGRHVPLMGFYRAGVVTGAGLAGGALRHPWDDGSRCALIEMSRDGVPLDITIPL
jgi:hypothetical protein